jgi:hypothetical protein
MFREPEEIAADQAAAKLERIAASSRSRIRREATVRPPGAPFHRIPEARRNRDTPEDTTDSLPRQQRDLNRELDELDHELGHLRSLRQSIRASNSRRDRRPRRRGSPIVDRPEPELRNEQDIHPPARPRDSAALDLSHEPLLDLGVDHMLPDSSESLAQHLPRPSRESGLRFEVMAVPQSGSDQPRRTRFYNAHTNRRLNGRASRQALPAGASTLSVLDALDNEYEDASLTPDFAPAQGPFPDSIPPQDDERVRPWDVNAVDGLMDTPPPEGLDAVLPPLRRVNHISPTPRGVSFFRVVDGLGDRLRSPSPPSENHDEENWANLLTTIEHGRSSAATSFMSSRSASRSASNRSSQATTTATSFGEIGGDDSCDLDLPSGITEEDVRQIRARHNRLPNPPASGSLSPRRRDTSGPASTLRQLTRGNERTLELEVFGVILDRMQRREEIPDEYWAAVGLSPDVVRGNA